MGEAFELQRFVAAQESVYEGALEELHRGMKLNHWMWFIFPQLHGLGRSETARFYGIKGRQEAEAYLRHPVLGARLLECTKAVNAHCNSRVDTIFGYPDTLKFHSCMTLFAVMEGESSPFAEALRVFFNAEYDENTLRLLSQSRAG